MRLEIVVARDCPECEEARSVARLVHERFPALDVDLIELDGRRQPPSHVVATPTYLLDGTVISLGNPRPEALVQAIRRHHSRPP